MKHHCRYCGEKLMEDEDRVTGTCENCIVTFFEMEQEFQEIDEYDPTNDWVECPYCGVWYDALDPYSECGCYYGGDDE